jgi:transposase InsO family protein
LNIGKITAEALVDSGSQVNGLSLDTYRKSGLQNKYPLQNSVIKVIEGVSGETAEVLGAITLPINLGGITTSTEFLVLQKLNYAAILGLEFLQNNNATLDFQNRVLSLQHGVTKVQLNNVRVQQPQYATTMNNIRIPPFSEVVIPLKSPRDNKLRGDIRLEPAHSMLKQRHLVGSKCITTTKHTTFKILNPTDRNITIAKGKKVAVCSPINENEEIVVIDASQETQINTNQIPEQTGTTDNAESNAKTSQQHLKDAENIGCHITRENLTEDQYQELLKLIAKNSDLFATDLSQIGHTTFIKHKIHKISDKPIRQRPYQTSPMKKRIIQQHVEALLKNNIIERADNSLYSSPIVLVRKKGASPLSTDYKQYRMCVDYRAVNKEISQTSFPIPRVNEILDSLGTTAPKYITCLDLYSGYLSMALEPESRDMTAFSKSDGVNRYTRTPFGLVSSPRHFLHVLSIVLQGLSTTAVMAYVDDLIIFSANFEQHIRDVQTVCDRLRRADLRLAPGKCYFAQNKVHYLGHVVSTDGSIQMDPEKVEVIENYPAPKNVKQVRQAVGLFNYYRRFIKDFSKIAIPLNNLLKTDTPFRWSEECEEAFTTLKQKLVENATLRLPNFNEPFILSCDASNHAMGAVLSQKVNGFPQPVAYYSKALTIAEQKHSTTHRELLALYSAVQFFAVYLADRPVDVVTDHMALTHLAKLRDPTGKFSRMISYLSEFRLNIAHTAGRLLVVPDALSRIDHQDMEAEKRKRLSKANKAQTAKADNGQEEGTNGQEGTGSQQASYTEVATTGSTIKVKGQDDDPRREEREEEGEMSINLMEEEGDKREYREHRLIYGSQERIQTTSGCIMEVHNMQDNHPENTRQGDNARQRLDLLRRDPFFGGIITYLEQEELPENARMARNVLLQVSEYVLQDDTLFHLYIPKGRRHKPEEAILQTVVPKELRAEVLRSTHDSLFGGGHFGIARAFEFIRSRYFWPGLFGQVAQYIQTCNECQRGKLPNHAVHKRTLTPIPTHAPFFRVNMDIMGPLPKSAGYSYILLITDSFSKYPEAYPMKTATAKEVADLLYNQYIVHWGAPHSILTDQGANFMSQLIKQICQIFQIVKLRTSSYHPQCDGLAERFFRHLKAQLRIYCYNRQDQWSQVLPSILYAYRATPNASTGQAPFYTITAMQMRLPLDVAYTPSPKLGREGAQHIDHILNHIQLIRNIAKENIQEAQRIYKQGHDKTVTTRSPEYVVGNRVWLWTPRLRALENAKLTPQWRGPLYVTEIRDHGVFYLRWCVDDKLIGPIAYRRLAPYHDPSLRPQAPMEPQLETIEEEEELEENEEVGDQPATPNIPDTQDNDPNVRDSQLPPGQFRVEKILGTRTRFGKKEYKVQWLGYPVDQASWEKRRNINTEMVQQYHIDNPPKRRGKRR